MYPFDSCAMSPEEATDGTAAGSVLGRLGEPVDIAHAVSWLCSERASYSVGSTYFVDGGMLKTV